jgi:MATE family multidrug resistance protein
MLSRAGLIILFSVDSIMTGRAGASQLAHYAIALAPQLTLLVLGIGLLIGTIVLTAQADGAGRTADCGPIWSISLWIAAVMGSLAGVAMLWGEPILLLFGQGPELALGGGRTLAMFAPGMPAALMFIATVFFLEGIGRPKAGMVVALAANLPNAALNWVLIYGHLGAPEMGAAGAALATTITRWAMLVALLAYVLSMAGRAHYGIGSPISNRVAVVRKVFRIGAPLSLAVGLEAACFSTIATFAGRLGEASMASYQITLNVVSFVFMLAIGLSTATSVRVANAVGRADAPGVAAAGWIGLWLTFLMVFPIAALIYLFQGPIARLYSDDAAVLAIAVPALAIGAVIVLVDGAQTVILGALRGAGDVLLPTLTYLVTFWGLTIPLAYHFGLSGSLSGGLSGGLGIRGMLWALFAGLACALVLLGWRFAVVSRRPVRPV